MKFSGPGALQALYQLLLGNLEPTLDFYQRLDFILFRKDTNRREGGDCRWSLKARLHPQYSPRKHPREKRTICLIYLLPYMVFTALGSSMLTRFSPSRRSGPYLRCKTLFS